MGTLHQALTLVTLTTSTAKAEVVRPQGAAGEQTQTPQQPLQYPAGWPAPNWTTVPTYTFCGPGKRPFNQAELDFISGKAAVGYTPRWMALGCAREVVFRLGSRSGRWQSEHDRGCGSL